VFYFHAKAAESSAAEWARDVVDHLWEPSMSSSTSLNPNVAFQKDREAASRPIWREAFVGLDWIALRSSPVLSGLGVPHGDKSAVVVIPGFMGTDHYLYRLHSWLRRINYRPYFSRIGWNAECPNLLVDRLSQTIEKAANTTNGKVHLIGHSLGGVLARSAATRSPDHVSSVITLGSPFRGIRSHPWVLGTAEKVRTRIMNRPGQRENQPDCYTGYCGCRAVTDLQSAFPSDIKNTAVFTKTDGIVDWRVCINDDPSTNFEVSGTHIGLVFNPSVYKLIALRLSTV
jgi:pimeloyl-ACP methyl ester carboxylesterase